MVRGGVGGGVGGLGGVIGFPEGFSACGWYLVECLGESVFSCL